MDLFIFVCIPSVLNAAVIYNLVASHEAYHAASPEWNIMFHRAVVLFITSIFYLWMTMEYLSLGGI